MAFNFAESFEKFTSKTELQRFYFTDEGTSSVLSIDSTHGRWGTPCLKVAINLAGSTLVNAWIQKDCPAVSGNTHVSHFAIKFNDLPTATGGGFGIWSAIDLGFTTTQVWLRLNTDLTLSMLRGSTVLATSTRALALNRYHYIELKTTVRTSTNGSVDVRVDNETTGWISASGINTANAGVDGWGFTRLGMNVGPTLGQSRGNALVMYFDDWLVLDGSGGALDDWQGQVWVNKRKPTAETASSQDWTPSTGTDNSANVDDSDPNGDTDRNDSSTVNHRDLFVLEDVSAASPTILCYQPYLVMRKAHAGSASVASTMKQSSTEYPEAGQNPGTSYTGHMFPIRLNPATSALLTYSDANANDWGYKKTA